MKVMIDTNIILSALLFPKGRAAQAFYKSLEPPFEPLVCRYIIDEVERKFTEKFANHASKLRTFKEILPLFTVVASPAGSVAGEIPVRDVKDMPILRAALAAKADFLLTGDKDFLDAEIKEPKVLCVAQFLTL